MNLIPLPHENFGAYANFGEFSRGVFRSATNDSRAYIHHHRAIVHSGLKDDDANPAASGYVARVSDGEVEIGSITLIVKKLPGTYYSEDGGSLILAYEAISHEDSGHFYRVGAAISVFKEEFLTDDKYEALVKLIQEVRARVGPMEYDDLIARHQLLKRAANRLDQAAKATKVL